MKYIIIILLLSFNIYATTEIEFVYIPKGYFIMGDNNYDENFPKREVFLSEFYISKYEISNKIFFEYLKDSKRKPPTNWTGINGMSFFRYIPYKDRKKVVYQKIPDFIKELPIVNISYNDALQFCKWLSKKNNKFYCLPTEAQWEKAARGLDARKYPWGNSQNNYKNKMNFRNKWNGIQTLKKVNSFKKGISYYGCYNMSGNVAEWTLDNYSKEYPKISPKIDPINIIDESNIKTIRGGSFISKHFSEISTYSRSFGYRNVLENEYTGFRIVMIKKNSPFYDIQKYYFDKMIKTIK